MTADRLKACDLRVRGMVTRLRSIETDLGRELTRISSRRDLTPIGATTFPLYCEKVGLSAAEGFQLRDAAKACAKSRELDKRVKAGRVSIQAAATAGQVLDNPDLERPGPGLLDLAEKSTARDFQQEVNKRKTEERIKETPTKRVIFLSRLGLDNLGRTKKIVGRKRRMIVSDSEAVEHVLGDFVEREDPERKAARARERARKREEKKSGKRSAASFEGAPPRTPGRSGPDAKRPESKPESKNGKPSRYIPADEKRKVIEAFGDRCWVDGCNDDVFVDFSHRRAYRHRGRNGARNLRRFCRRHHQLTDSGTIKIVKGARGALLVDRTGNCVGKLRGPPP